ncbi:hypothetical protein [Porphyromonas circumdentaria]|uniref:hypothetical protein n=1 Tax=Porphyromonas circumdentaria TaxID=29524 RepID=UPI0026DC0ED0|nr:hypothetical protein [Porphyromonas circumdentaria]MDO4722637.1 hypothetical protein [Porphyromonas circumdentaria]
MKTDIKATLLFLLLLGGLASCIRFDHQTVANRHEIFGKVGYICDEPNSLVAFDSHRSSHFPLSKDERLTLSQGDTLTIKYDLEESKDNLLVRLCFALRDVRNDHPNYLKNFDVTGYKKRRPRLERRYESYCARYINFCMAKVEKVEITSNYAFGKEYPVGKDLAPLSKFVLDSYEEYIQNNFQRQEGVSFPNQRHRVKGDDSEAWSKSRLYDSKFEFWIPKPALLAKDKDVVFTFTFHLVDKLRSETARKTLKRTIRLKIEPHKQA